MVLVAIRLLFDDFEEFCISSKDDNGIATQYRNEFEVGFERLRDSAKTPSAEHFTSESGWV